MRIVLDTNVLISGIMLPGSIPGRIVDAWRNSCFTLVLSDEMLDEISRVLHYPKIAKRLLAIGMNEEDLGHLLSLMRFQADFVDITQIEATVPDDPDDTKILATFIAGQADYLVSGDADLLALRDTYLVLTPQEFWQRCG